MNSIQQLSSFLQALPDFRGKRRLGRLAVKLSGAAKEKEFIVQTRAGKFLIPNLKDSISLDLFVDGYYEKGLVDLLVKIIPANGVWLDIGANIGSVCIATAHRRPDVKIIAVEASPWIYKYLKRNIELNGVPNITPINFAVYSESGKSMPMFAPRDLFGKGSLKSVYTSESEMVRTLTIDDIKNKYRIPVVHFIKVDVEGFEASVFSGLSSTASSDRPQVVFEFSEWAETEAGFKAGEAQSIMLNKGYRLQELDANFNPIGAPSMSPFKVKNANLLAF